MIEPPPDCRMPGTTACAAKNCGRRLIALVLVPIFARHIVDIVSVIPSRVIDEYRNWPIVINGLRDRVPQRFDIGRSALR